MKRLPSFLLRLVSAVTVLGFTVFPSARAGVSPKEETGFTTKAEAYYHFFLGKQYETQGKFSKAADEYARVKALDPEAAEPLLALAQILLRQNHTDQAEKHLQAALSIEPSNIEALYLTVFLKESKDDIAGAAESMEKIIRLQPNSEKFLMKSLQLFWAIKDEDAALAYMKRILTYSPGFAEGLWNLAELYRKKGNVDEAIQTLEKILEAKGNDPSVRSELARLYNQKGNVQMAGYHLEAIANYFSDDLDKLVQVVQSLVKVKDFPRAARVYKKILDLDPRNFDAWLQFLRCSLISGWNRIVIRESSQLLSLLEKSSETQRDSGKMNLMLKADVYKLRGLAFLGIADQTSALESFQKALSYRENLEEDTNLRLSYIETLSLKNKGKAYEEILALSKKLKFDDAEQAANICRVVEILLDLEKKEQAKEMIASLMSAQANDSNLLIELARISAKGGLEQEADNILQGALNRFPDRERELQFLRARILLDSGKKKECYSIMEHWIEKEPKQAEAYIQLARFHAEDKDFAGAYSILKKAAPEFPDNEVIEFQLGAVSERLGNMAESELHLKRVLELNPNNAAALNYLGYSWTERNTKLEEAKSNIEKALDLDPGNGAYLDSLGWVYFKMEKLGEAEDYLLQAIDRIGSDSVVFSHLADVFLKEGKFQEAAEYYRKALDSRNPENIQDIKQKMKEAREKLKGKSE